LNEKHVCDTTVNKFVASGTEDLVLTANVTGLASAIDSYVWSVKPSLLYDSALIIKTLFNGVNLNT